MSQLSLGRTRSIGSGISKQLNSSTIRDQPTKQRDLRWVTRKETLKEKSTRVWVIWDRNTAVLFENERASGVDLRSLIEWFAGDVHPLRSAPARDHGNRNAADVGTRTRVPRTSVYVHLWSLDGRFRNDHRSRCRGRRCFAEHALENVPVS